MNMPGLEARFQQAVAIADNMSQAELPQDVQLRLYAYFKKATYGTPSAMSSNIDLRNAFKSNALMQVGHMTPDEAKQHYVELIESLIRNQ
jgi:acyl-CoA-binding protein